MNRSSTVHMKRFILVTTFFASSLVCLAQFKVVGYLPTYRFGSIGSIDLSKLTHINLSFANPDSDGDLVISPSITSIVNTAHASDVLVFISIGGAGVSSTVKGYYDNLMTPANRANFIHKIRLYLEANSLDGIDVDLEGDDIHDTYYGPFVEQLVDTLSLYGLKVSAAVASWNAEWKMPDEAIAAFDWINLMSYDATGPWAPDSPGQHSSYNFAQNDINYWKGRGVPADNIVLGVPFYGYEFVNSTTVNTYTYANIVATHSGAENNDQVGNLYYNGIPTIQAKTALAINQASGIMIWELGQDDFGSKSLLDAIADQMAITKVEEESELKVVSVLYPNPVKDVVTINGIKSGYLIKVLNSTGQVVKKVEVINKQEELSLSMKDMAPGTYLIQIISSEGSIIRRLSKI